MKKLGAIILSLELIAGFSGCKVTVEEVKLTGIEIITEPTKKVYFVGEDLDLTGLEVTATYDNGKTENVTAEVTTNGFDSSAAVES